MYLPAFVCLQMHLQQLQCTSIPSFGIQTLSSVITTHTAQSVQGPVPEAHSALKLVNPSCASDDTSAINDNNRPTPTAPSYPCFQTLYSQAIDDSSSMLSDSAVSCDTASAAQPIPRQSGHVHPSHALDCPQSGRDSVLMSPGAPRRPQPQSPFCGDNPM